MPFSPLADGNEAGRSGGREGEVGIRESNFICGCNINAALTVMVFVLGIMHLECR